MQAPLLSPLRERAADAGPSRAERTDARPAPAGSSEVWLVVAVAALLASIGVVGSDALWLVPLGAKVAHGHMPSSVQYATAPSHGWHDTSALGQLVFWALYHAFGGLRGVVVAQVAAVAVAFGALARGLRRETSAGGVLVVAAIVLLGTLAEVVVANAELYSLALFAVLVWLLESERPLWWSVLLIALWGNLHGGVLAGWALLACYVVFARRRAYPVLGAATVALFLNPALWHTPSYYESVFHSEIARRAEGLWAPLGFGPLDVLVIVAAAGLGALAFRHVRLWEAVALLGLAAATVHVARNSVSLLFLAAYPAARALRLRAPQPRMLLGVAGLVGVLALPLLVRGPADPGSQALAEQAAATGQPVLADTIVGQQVVLAGGRVWVENPLDAFSRADQRLYLDWLDGRGDGAVERVGYVLVTPDSPAGRRAARDARLTRVAATERAVLYRVRSG